MLPIDILNGVSFDNPSCYKLLLLPLEELPTHPPHILAHVSKMSYRPIRSVSTTKSSLLEYGSTTPVSVEVLAAFSQFKVLLNRELCQKQFISHAKATSSPPRSDIVEARRLPVARW